MKQIALLVAVVMFWNCSMAAGAETQRTDNGGASLENQLLRVTAVPGQVRVGLWFKSAGTTRRAEIALQSSGATKSEPLGKARVVEDNAGERVLRVAAGTAQVEITLGLGPFVKITPVKDAASVEVKAITRYVALPDFFADDVIFDPIKFTTPEHRVPAENVLLQFLEGGDTIVMCIWQGNLKLQARGNAAVPVRNAIRKALISKAA